MTYAKLGLGTVAVIGMTIACGCGSETGAGSGGGGAGGATSAGGSGGDTATTGTGTLPGGAVTFAVHKLWIGDEANGQPSSTAWKSYGFNLDGKASATYTSDLCKPFPGAPASVHADGDNGIDNGFGKNVLPIVTTLATDASAQVNAAIDEGQFTMLVRIEGITPNGVGVFPAKAFTGAFAAGTMPSWNGGDKWPVRRDCLIDGALETPKAQYPVSEVMEDATGARVWRSTGVAQIDLELRAGDFVLVLPIIGAHISMELSPDNLSATHGRIGGVLYTQGLIDALATTAGMFDPNLCPPSSTFESIAQQIREAQDIMLDGTQDPNKECNGISIGLGFEAQAADLGDVFDAPMVPDPCSGG